MACQPSPPPDEIDVSFLCFPSYQYRTITCFTFSTLEKKNSNKNQKVSMAQARMPPPKPDLAVMPFTKSSLQKNQKESDCQATLTQKYPQKLPTTTTSVPIRDCRVVLRRSAYPFHG